MDIVQSVRDLFADGTPSTVVSLRSAFFAFFTFGDVLQIYIVYRNLRAIKQMDWLEFVKQCQFWTFKSPKTVAEKYNRHRDKQQLLSFGIAINNVVGLCIRCAKFSTNYYNVVWRMTDGRGLSLIGRACLFAAIDSLSRVVQDAITGIVEVVCDFRSVRLKETVVWFLTRPNHAIGKAASCYVAIFFLDRSHPHIFLAIWMVLGTLQLPVLWIILRYYETLDLHKPLPESMKIVTEKTGYPAKRIMRVTSIEVATRSHKITGAKYCNFIFKNYIFVSARLFDKLEEQESAAIVLREVGAWKMWWHTRSYLNTVLRFLCHGLLGYVVMKSYGSKTLEEIFKLEPGMHPMMTEWIIWGLLRHSFSSFHGSIAGILGAIAELHQDDFVSETLETNSALFDAVVKQTEIDLMSASIYDGWYSRRFIGEPTVWERLDRTTKRYFPNHRDATTS